MSRESIVQLIKLKKELYQKQHDAGLRKVALEEKLAFASIEEQADAEATLAVADAEESAVQLEIKRAHQFGLRFAKSPFPSICMPCFVGRGESTTTSEVESKFGNGFRQFKCPVCSAQLSVAPV